MLFRSQRSQASSVLLSAALPLHGAEPAHTRMTGSPVHDPMAVPQSAPASAAAVLLHPTVTVRPGTQEKVRPGCQLHSRERPEKFPVQGRVGSPLLASGGEVASRTPASLAGMVHCCNATACAAHIGELIPLASQVRPRSAAQVKKSVARPRQEGLFVNVALHWLGQIPV